jgi:hypothetical protein
LVRVAGWCVELLRHRPRATAPDGAVDMRHSTQSSRTDRARHSDIGRPFFRAVTTLDALAFIEEPPPAGAEGIPVDAVIIDRAELPVYLRITDKARHVREPDMSD